MKFYNISSNFFSSYVYQYAPSQPAPLTFRTVKFECKLRLPINLVLHTLDLEGCFPTLNQHFTAFSCGGIMAVKVTLFIFVLFHIKSWNLYKRTLRLAYLTLMPQVILQRY